jgi:hypothetical protein
MSSSPPGLVYLNYGFNRGLYELHAGMLDSSEVGNYENVIFIKKTFDKLSAKEGIPIITSSDFDQIKDTYETSKDIKQIFIKRYNVLRGLTTSFELDDTYYIYCMPKLTVDKATKEEEIIDHAEKVSKDVEESSLGKEIEEYLGKVLEKLQNLERVTHDRAFRKELFTANENVEREKRKLEKLIAELNYRSNLDTMYGANSPTWLQDKVSRLYTQKRELEKNYNEATNILKKLTQKIQNIIISLKITSSVNILKTIRTSEHLRTLVKKLRLATRVIPYSSSINKIFSEIIDSLTPDQNMPVNNFVSEVRRQYHISFKTLKSKEAIFEDLKKFISENFAEINPEEEKTEGGRRIKHRRTKKINTKKVNNTRHRRGRST